MTIQTVSRGSSYGEGGRVRVQACLPVPHCGSSLCGVRTRCLGARWPSLHSELPVLLTHQAVISRHRSGASALTDS